MKRQTILVIEDQQGVRLAATKLLEEFGFFVISANSGREGVQMFRRLADEILGVIVSGTLFDMDGEQMLEEITSVRPTALVIMSGSRPEDETTRTLREKGLSGYVKRPYEPEALLRTLREVLP